MPNTRYIFITTNPIDLSALGFGDELQIDYDPATGNLRVSVFQNNHWQDEAIIPLPSLFQGAQTSTKA